MSEDGSSSRETNEWAHAGVLHEPTPSVEVPEVLVHDLWEHQRFDPKNLTTTEDVPVRVLDPGRPNDDAGPDFSGAHVRLGDMDWRGDVEVHIASGGWFEHDHHTDPRYDRVILHVTLRADVWTGGLLRPDESTVPELVLEPHLEAPLRSLLHAFRTRPDSDSLPCGSRWDQVPDSKKHEWFSHLARERLDEKQKRLVDRAETSLEESLHEALFAGLGYAKNDTPMRHLAQRLRPAQIRSLTDARNREAFHLGVAGLLPSPSELLDADRETADYAMALRDRFRRLQVQFNLPTMDASNWTFFRLRPNNFPPLRIAQAAAWYDEGGLLAMNPLAALRSALEQDDPVEALRTTLQAKPPSFWRRHYHLRTPAAEHDPSLGLRRRDTLLVNAVVPALLVHADRRNQHTQVEKCLQVLHSLSASQDSVVRRFRDLGTTAESAFQAQGLHQLYRKYCTQARCLECAIGQHLLGS